jgi:hypothetical protein
MTGMNDRGRNNLRLGELFLVCPKYPDLRASTPAKFSDHTHQQQFACPLCPSKAKINWNRHRRTSEEVSRYFAICFTYLLFSFFFSSFTFLILPRFISPRNV